MGGLEGVNTSERRRCTLQSTGTARQAAQAGYFEQVNNPGVRSCANALHIPLAQTPQSPTQANERVRPDT
jgi:hypothetical protein